jgi:hypothetical protein
VESHGFLTNFGLFGYGSYTPWFSFKYTLKDSAGNPLPPGVPLHEIITHGDTRYVAKWGEKHSDGITFAGGVAYDMYKVSFYRKDGYHTTTQTVQLPSGAKMTWHATIYATGKITMDVTSGTFR